LEREKNGKKLGEIPLSNQLFCNLPHRGVFVESWCFVSNEVNHLKGEKERRKRKREREEGGEGEGEGKENL